MGDSLSHLDDLLRSFHHRLQSSHVTNILTTRKAPSLYILISKNTCSPKCKTVSFFCPRDRGDISLKLALDLGLFKIIFFSHVKMIVRSSFTFTACPG